MGENEETNTEKKSLLDVFDNWNSSAYYWTFVVGAGAGTTCDSIQQGDLETSLFRGCVSLLSLGFAYYSYKKSKRLGIKNGGSHNVPYAKFLCVN